MRFSWLYSWLGFRKLSRRQRRYLKRKRNYIPLRVERLEDRLAPTVDMWTGGAGTLNWTDAANWSTGAVPISTDDVQINVPVSGPITINIANATNQSIHSLTDTTAALYVTGGSLTIAANSSISQDLPIAGGTLTASNLNVAGVFTESGGTLNESGTLTVTNAMDWTGGTIGSGAGQTEIASGATLQIAGNVTLSGTLSNYGSAVWTAGTPSIQDGGVFNNEAGATFDAQFDGTINDGDYADPTGGSFVNAGTFLKSAGTGSTTVTGYGGVVRGLLRHCAGGLQQPRRHTRRSERNGRFARPIRQLLEQYLDGRDLHPQWRPSVQ